MQWTLQQINRQDLNPNAKTNGDVAIGDPFVSVYNDQQHIAYRVAGGAVEDCWYGGGWQKQTINLGQGAPCAVGPSIGVYNDQQHFVVVSGPPNEFGGAQPGYPPIGSIWDAWYDGKGDWTFQEINLGGRTSAHAAAYEPFMFVSPVGAQGPTFRVSVWTWDNQQHFTYFTPYNVVIDAFWDGSSWQQQTINTIAGTAKGNTSGGPAVGDPFGCVFRPNAGAGMGQQHITYRDGNGTIWDCWYDPLVGPHGTWKQQTINAGGATEGTPAILGPVVWTTPATLNAGGYDGAQHFAYVDANHNIWDAYYDGSWHIVQVNGSTQANSPIAAGGLWACAFFSEYQASQSHIAYRDASGGIWDVWFDYVTGSWGKSQVNEGAGASAIAVGDPFVWTCAGADGGTQLHVTYRAANGVVLDGFWELPPGQPGGRAGP